jgi:hypothetical protein
VLFCLLVARSSAAENALPRLSYNDDIQPILAENCFLCHGPDSSTRKAALRLDRFADATVARENGKWDPAIVPGNPAASPLVERIKSSDPEDVMPPRDSHKQLKPEEIARLERWVAEGAEYQQHWSLIPPVRPAVPAPAAAKGWARNPIDAFIVDALAGTGLSPSAPESPARLLRRVTFDLTGLPPTAQELAAFERDPSPAAYDRVIDRLLASPASAEHLARQWLDAVRYADTHGIHIDNYRSIWPYRDWVIGAFQRNLPFNQFTVEQIAGDLLPNATLDQRIASGFNRCLPTTNEGGAIPEEYEVIYAKDRVDTLGSVWLGLTVGCAACHDHKFDPITQKDFYSLTAFFRNNTMPSLDGNLSDSPPSMFVPAAADRESWAGLQKKIAELAGRITAEEKVSEPRFTAWRDTANSLPPLPRDHSVGLYLPLTEPNGPLANTDGKPLTAGQPEPARVAGVHGPAPKLSGLDVVLGPPVPMRWGQSQSFGLLVRVEGTPTGTLLSSLADDASGSGWEIFFENGRVGVNFIDGIGGVAARGVAAAALTPGRWHQLLFVNDAAAMRSRSIDVYVDGKSVTSTGETSNFPNDIVPAAPLRLASRHKPDGHAGHALTGDVWVQDLRHYTRGFEASEVQAMLNPAEAGLALATPAAERTDAQQETLRQYYRRAVDRPLLKLTAKLSKLRAQEVPMRQRGGMTLVMEEKKDSEPVAHILKRGEYTRRQEQVGANTPAVLPPLPGGMHADRLALAQWLVDERNPLTARVTVNRAWQAVFGTGIVDSAGDFGVTGSRPSHPRLLDWLAVEFRESGWDYRRMLRLMVTSATYRQSAAASPAAREKDPDNRLLARGPRHRLEAEQLRDQALAASGLLVAKIGGKPVRPYQPEGIWEEVAMKQSTTRFYRVDSGENLYRRSLYTLWKRTAPPPSMDILNAPSREVSCVRRDRTNTPLQALVVLNEPIFVEASRQLAARACREGGTFERRTEVMARALLGRRLADEEAKVIRTTFDKALAAYQQQPEVAAKLLSVGASPAEARVPAPELAAWTLVASQIMNLDEALTK